MHTLIIGNNINHKNYLKSKKSKTLSTDSDKTSEKKLTI